MKPHAQDKPKASRKACQSKSDAVAARERDDKRKRRAIYTAFRKRFGKAWKVQTIHGKGEVFVKVSREILGGEIRSSVAVPLDTRIAATWADTVAASIVAVVTARDTVAASIVAVVTAREAP